MATPTDMPLSTRVKACLNCRQQKLRCDARKDYSRPCSRCDRLGMNCVVNRSFDKVKGKSKAKLQKKPSRPGMRTQMDSYPRSEADMTIVATPEPVVNIRNSTPVSPPQTLNYDEFDPVQMQDCFALFMRNYAPQVTVINPSLDPAACFSLSPLLFWTIVTIGSRKYNANPTMLGLLAPRLASMIQAAVFVSDLATIQAFLLLCIWPIPIDTLSKEISTLLSAMMIQFSVNSGLHIPGIGQDFSRSTLAPDSGLELARAKIWFSCLTTAQRVHCSHGLPPPSILDNYEQPYFSPALAQSLPPGLLFQRKVLSVLVEATTELGKATLNETPIGSRELLSMIRVYSSQLAQIPDNGMDVYGQYDLLCAQLQVQSFQIFVGQRAADHAALMRLYHVACAVIEACIDLDGHKQFSLYASDYTGRMLHLATSLILRICRSSMKEVFDLQRGQEAYFSAILFFRRMSVQNDDIMARSTVIVAQLWTSPNIFLQPDGSVDSFTLLCRSRLAMSSVFDVWWRWRKEFAGQPHPYPNAVSSPVGITNSEAGLANSVNDLGRHPTDPAVSAMMQDVSIPYDWDAMFDAPIESWDLFNLDANGLTSTTHSALLAPVDP